MAADGSDGDGRVLRIPTGVTPTERYLKRLCDRTFLSLWSYPGIYRDQGRRGGGKEVCDLLVVFEDHVLIFSDKSCDFPDTGDLKADWTRWFRRAIEKAADQAWGAERWIREHPDRLFVGPECRQRFPLPLGDPTKLQFHRVVVAHNSSERCRREFNGGSGTLLIQSALVGAQHYDHPFHVGRIDASKGFVHVLDDVTLDLLLNELDTVADLTAYLDRRERFLTGYPTIWAAGEEELLALYLQRVNADGEHDFILPPTPQEDIPTFLGFEEGFWAEFQGHRDRLARIEADRVSYTWDALIEKFTFHITTGTLEEPLSTEVAYHEHALRRLAREPRTVRRSLSRDLLEVIQNTPPGYRRVKVAFSEKPEDTCFVFLVLPSVADTEKEDRRIRREVLLAHCHVAKLTWPTARHIVGIATEAGIVPERSEDLVYLDTASWTEADEEQARRIQAATGFLKAPEVKRRTEREYPRP